MLQRAGAFALATLLVGGAFSTFAARPAAADSEDTYRVLTYGAAGAAAYGLVTKKPIIAVAGAAGAYLAHKKWKDEVNERHRRDGRGHRRSSSSRAKRNSKRAGRYDRDDRYRYNRDIGYNGDLGGSYDRDYDSRYDRDYDSRYDRDYDSRYDRNYDGSRHTHDRDCGHDDRDSRYGYDRDGRHDDHDDDRYYGRDNDDRDYRYGSSRRVQAPAASAGARTGTARWVGGKLVTEKPKK